MSNGKHWWYEQDITIQTTFIHWWCCNVKLQTLVMQTVCETVFLYSYVKLFGNDSTFIVIRHVSSSLSFYHTLNLFHHTFTKSHQCTPSAYSARAHERSSWGGTHFSLRSSLRVETKVDSSLGSHAAAWSRCNGPLRWRTSRGSQVCLWFPSPVWDNPEQPWSTCSFLPWVELHQCSVRNCYRCASIYVSELRPDPPCSQSEIRVIEMSTWGDVVPPWRTENSEPMISFLLGKNHLIPHMSLLLTSQW